MPSIITLKEHLDADVKKTARYHKHYHNGHGIAKVV
jgi:hypothetical protein